MLSPAHRAGLQREKRPKIAKNGPKSRKGPDFGLSTTNHANGANGEGSLPEKSRLWFPFSIRDIRFIRSAGCSVFLLPICVHPCPFVVKKGRKAEKAGLRAFNYESREWREWGGESSGKSRIRFPFTIRDIRFIRSEDRFPGRKSRFWVENGPKTAFSGGFSPFFACAARCGSFSLTSFCRKRSLRPAKREFYARREQE